LAPAVTAGKSQEAAESIQTKLISA